MTKGYLGTFSLLCYRFVCCPVSYAHWNSFSPAFHSFACASHVHIVIKLLALGRISSLKWKISHYVLSTLLLKGRGNTSSMHAHSQCVYNLQIQHQSVLFAVFESKWSIFRSLWDHRSVLHMQSNWCSHCSISVFWSMYINLDYLKM